MKPKVEVNTSKCLPSPPLSSFQYDGNAAAYHPVETLSMAPWPSQPMTIDHKSVGHRTGVWIWDAIVSLTPLVFIVIAFCALSLDHHEPSQYGKNILEAQKLGPTIFPVVFAAILGRFMTSLARWRAERGSQLGLLEQLNGSQSLFTALERIYKLSRWGPIGLSIIILWGLSPLGGQSSLRLLSVQPAVQGSTASLRYLNTNMTFDVGANTVSLVQAQVEALLQASFLASPKRRSSPSDAWDNVKVPMIETLPGYREKDDINPWLAADQGQLLLSENRTSQVSTNSSFPNTTYASLAGIPVVGLPSTLRSGFYSIEASYMSLQCLPFQFADISSGELAQRIGPLAIHSNSSQLTTFGQRLKDTGPDYFLDFPKNSKSNPDLIWAHQHEGDPPPGSDEYSPGWAWTSCKVATRHVEANVSCTPQSCAVTHMRRSNIDKRPPEISPFQPNGESSLTPSMMNLFGGLPYLTNQPGTSGRIGRNAVLTYLIDPSSVNGLKTSQANNFIVRHTAPSDFSIRLSQVLNTYMQFYWAPAYMSGGAPTDLKAYGNQTLAWSTGFDFVPQPDTPPFPNNVSTAYLLTDEAPIYVSNRAWIAVLLVVSIVMLVAAVLGTVLKHQCHMPNVLGHVSSLTRDNPHVRAPPGGTMLDGLERARLLSQMYVQLGDTRPDEAMGHVALKSAILGDRGFDKSRKYC